MVQGSLGPLRTMSIGRHFPVVAIVGSGDLELALPSLVVGVLGDFILAIEP